MVKRAKWILVAGARPNFMKIAPLIREIERYNAHQRTTRVMITPILVHTGQHYDKSLSEVFFKELNIPKPDIDLGVGSGSHGEQTGRIMIAFEHIVMKKKPSVVVVVGDVNSTVACALVAAKLHIPVAHVEAGLRSFDRSMPEEINRVLTDQISDFLFTPSRDANRNLLKEGISGDKIYFVGNIMIDSLKLFSQHTINSTIFTKLNKILFKDGMTRNQYAILTLHRPAIVDRKDTLQRVLNCLYELSKQITILFPVHPRTKKQIDNFGLKGNITWLNDDFRILNDRRNNNDFYGLPPLGYLDFIALMKEAQVIFTDSGGIQEETAVLGVNCITLRENTERPITLKDGANVLVGSDPGKIKRAFIQAVSPKHISRKVPEFWDGKTAERIVKILANRIQP